MASPRAAYIHIPFCSRRCGYCNFTLVADREDLVDAYLEAIESEFALLEQPIEVDTIFWGGGTPTYLAPRQLTRLLDTTRRWLPLAANGEWSCEANPLDCSREKLQLLAGAGVNRLSLGGQSFRDQKLQTLERDHSAAELCQAYATGRDYFKNVAIDMIFAAPGETVTQWREDLESLLAIRPDHVSTYGLTIEKGAAFYGRQLRGLIRAVEEDSELEMYQLAIQVLEAAGLEHYEVSNFALPGKRCRHNEAYWLGMPWLALGPGAAAFDGVRRTVNHRSTTAYIRRLRAGESPIVESEVLSVEQQVREAFVFGLRRMEGVDIESLAARFDRQVTPMFEPYLSRALEAGWLQQTGSRIRLTPAGLVISDSLWPDFLAE